MGSIAKKILPDLTNVDEVLKEYDSWMRGYEKNLKVDMKTYSKANSEQAGWLAYYSEMHDELVVMYKDMDDRLKLARAVAANKLQRVASRKHTENETKAVVDADQTVIDTTKTLREIEERKMKAETIVKAFDQRGFTLNNMTRIRMGGFQDERMYVNED